MSNRLIPSTAALALALACTPSSWAQEKGASHLLRILPVGASPPMRIEIKNGVRHEAEPPQGSLPPSKVYLTAGAASVPADLRLADCSQPISLVLKDTRTATLSANPVTEDGERPTPWLRMTLPKTSRSLAVLFRSPASTNWDKPKVIVLPDGRKEFGGGCIRFVNTSPLPVLILVGKQKPQSLQPGKSMLSHPVTAPIDIPVRMAIRDKEGTLKNICQLTVNLDAQRRANMVAYWADPGRSRLPPVQVCLIRERLPTPPQPDKKQDPNS